MLLWDVESTQVRVWQWAVERGRGGGWGAARPALPWAASSSIRLPHTQVLARTTPPACWLLFVNAAQVAQRLPGRASADDAGDGHCDAVLCTAASDKRPLIATGAHEKDCSIKLWAAQAAAS